MIQQSQFLHIYPDKTVVQKIHAPLFIALLTRAENMKTPEMPTTEENKADVDTDMLERCSARRKVKPPAATRMQLEMTRPSASGRDTQIPCGTAYTRSLSYDTDELVYKTDTGSGA